MVNAKGCLGKSSKREVKINALNYILALHLIYSPYCGIYRSPALIPNHLCQDSNCRYYPNSPSNTNIPNSISSSIERQRIHIQVVVSNKNFPRR